jgi:hypothetical protein
MRAEQFNPNFPKPVFAHLRFAWSSSRSLDAAAVEDISTTRDALSGSRETRVRRPNRAVRQSREGFLSLVRWTEANSRDLNVSAGPEGARRKRTRQCAAMQGDNVILRLQQLLDALFPPIYDKNTMSRAFNILARMLNIAVSALVWHGVLPFH